MGGCGGEIGRGFGVGAAGIWVTGMRAVVPGIVGAKIDNAVAPAGGELLIVGDHENRLALARQLPQQFADLLDGGLAAVGL